MENISIVNKSYLCASCGACYTICPTNAISFRFTSIGRKYPTVNSKCTKCGLCLKVCPTTDYNQTYKVFDNKFIGGYQNVYVGHSSNKTIYSNAQSGGLATSILAYLFDQKQIDIAICCKMTTGKKPEAKAIAIYNKQDLLECQKSCYTPVDLLSALKNIDKNKKIGIVGLPCHIQGAVKLIKTSTRYKNIILKIGLICDRTLCSGIIDVFASISRYKNFKIEWRKKDYNDGNNYYPYKTAPVAAISSNKEVTVFPNTYRMKLKDFFTAPRCRVCYDKLNTHADIVLGDPWGMSNVDWNKGDSVVITRTDIGQKLIDEIIENKIATLTKGDFTEVYRGQYIENREKQFIDYLKVVNVLNPSFDSYLTQYKSNDGEEKLKAEFLNFIEKEKLSKKQIIAQAKNIIGIQEKPSIIKRCWHFTKRILSKIKKIITK